MQSFATMCARVHLWQTLQRSCVFAGAPCSLTPLLEPLSPSPWSSVHDSPPPPACEPHKACMNPLSLNVIQLMESMWMFITGSHGGFILYTSIHPSPHPPIHPSIPRMNVHYCHPVLLFSKTTTWLCRLQLQWLYRNNPKQPALLGL